MADGDPFQPHPKTDHMTGLEKTIGYKFKSKALLSQALTHSSAMGDTSYERLEFVGDRVLGLAIADMLYKAFPKESEGDLAKRLNALVKRDTLKKVADHIGLQADIVSGGKAKQNVTPSVLADVVEALIAAIYLDGGFAAAKTFIEENWSGLIRQSAQPPEDSKSILQEWAQGKGYDLPKYILVERSGPDHQPHFIVEASIKGFDPQRGEGVSKQLAEKAAARNLYHAVTKS